MNDSNAVKNRSSLQSSKRVVLKLDTDLILDEDGHFIKKSLNALIDDIAALKAQKIDVILVSSGAIETGLKELNLKKRPTIISELQAAASAGQLTLLNYYHKRFKKHHCKITPVLLSHADLKNRERHLNARNTLLKLLRYNLIPIINENDAVSNEEIKFGGNDLLSAQTAVLLDADLLILLTTPNGLVKSIGHGEKERVSYLDCVDDEALNLANKNLNRFGKKGLYSKLLAAQRASMAGIPVVIASGFRQDVIPNILKGKDVGTYVYAKRHHKNEMKRRQWMNSFRHSLGKVHVRKDAALAIQQRGASLLPAGIKAVEGSFGVGAFIEIVALNGDVIAHGLSEYDHSDIHKIKGAPSSSIYKILRYKNSNAVIHRNNMVLVKN
jgi:glutamate 5-kinase